MGGSQCDCLGFASCGTMHGDCHAEGHGRHDGQRAPSVGAPTGGCRSFDHQKLDVCKCVEGRGGESTGEGQSVSLIPCFFTPPGEGQSVSFTPRFFTPPQFVITST